MSHRTGEKMHVAEVKSYARLEIEHPEIHGLLRELHQGVHAGPQVSALVKALQQALLLAPFGGGHDPK
jgi:hypothetical protein